MTEHHEHVCTCGERFPIVDADVLKRQTAGPIALTNTGTIHGGSVTVSTAISFGAAWTPAAVDQIAADLRLRGAL